MSHTKFRTSESHPLRIDWVQPEGAWGRIGMSFCPGKIQQMARTGAWQRDIHLDVRAIKESGVRMVVSLIELHEFAELHVATLPAVVRSAGLEWLHLPIVDMCPPNRAWRHLWEQLGQQIVDVLSRGDSVFVHCKGGLGRTGTVAACLLIESGMRPADAIVAVRAARRGTIETQTQEAFVVSYVPQWNQSPQIPSY